MYKNDSLHNEEVLFHKSIPGIKAYKTSLERSFLVVMIDRKGIIIYANDNFCKICKFSKEALIGKVNCDLTGNLFSKIMRSRLWEDVSNGNLGGGLLELKASDASFFWVDTMIVPLINTRGNVYQYVVIGTAMEKNDERISHVKKNKKQAEEILSTDEVFAFQVEEERKIAEELIVAGKEFNQLSKENKKSASELKVANKELVFQNNEKEKRAAELLIANRELMFQNSEKEKRAAELYIANNELAYQNDEKEKRAAELAIANNELALQNAEKEKRAAELLIANRELLFQNSEKEKRAAELFIANNELAYQNEEKEKRAAELVIANNELALQNEEKEKRAAELFIANNELAYQNSEKGNRAAELVIANNELAFQNTEKEKRAAELSIANRELHFQNEENENTAAALLIANKELEKANKELESFSYSVSHDLRAPLRAVNGYAKILEEDYGASFDDEGRRLLGIVQGNAKRMGVLIDDLLAFSKLGTKIINKSKVNMREMVDTVIEELQTANHFRAKINIKTVLPVLADKALTKQVWINLLSNAIKYSANVEAPLIEIDSERENGEIIYSVSDNGVGFDMQYAQKLFGVFQRLHTSEDFEGTGVGLALVQRIVNKQAGSVWAKGKVAKGATFYFSLPENDDKSENS